MIAPVPSTQIGSTAPIGAAARGGAPSSSSAHGPTAPGDMVAAANGFEAIFMRQLMSAMRQGKLGDDLFGGPSTEQFQAMQYDNIADSMAQNGNFGIAEMLLARFEHGGADAAP